MTDLRVLLHMLPPENVAVLKRLLPFLKQLSQHSEKNKMTTANLALMFGPSILRPKDGDIGKVVQNSAGKRHVLWDSSSNNVQCFSIRGYIHRRKAHIIL